MLVGFTGDLFLGSVFNAKAFQEIASALPDETELVINFEGTVFEHRNQLIPARRKILLDSPDTLLEMLDPLPISIVSAGNNHIADYGNAVAKLTLDKLKARYPVLGAGYEGSEFHVLIHAFGEVTVGFANYCTSDTSPLFCSIDRIGPRPLCLKQARRDVEGLKEGSDFCVAIVHWGYEDLHHPRPAQVKLGRRLIDAGYDLVIGHHSHTAQGYEQYEKGWIFFSLGNFYFPDHSVEIYGNQHAVKWKPRNAWGLIPLFDFSKKGIELKEVRISRQLRNGSPVFSKSERFAKRLSRYSGAISAQNYVSEFRRIRRLENLAIRYEEFLNNENKIGAVFRKLRKLAGGV